MSSMTHVVADNVVFHDILPLAHFATHTALKALVR